MNLQLFSAAIQHNFMYKVAATITVIIRDPEQDQARTGGEGGEEGKEEKAPVNLVHEEGHGLDQAAVLLSQEAMTSLLLLQGLLVAPLEKLHVLALILPTEGTQVRQTGRRADRQTVERSGTDQVVSSPQLPLQCRGLAVDLHLVELLAVLMGQRTSVRSPAFPWPPSVHAYRYEASVLPGVAVHLLNDLHAEPLQLGGRRRKSSETTNHGASLNER